LDLSPDVQFGSAAKKTPVSGGNARASYVATLYAIIMSHMHKPPGVGGLAPVVSVDFLVDAQGRVVQRRLGQSSGVATLDMAVMSAVAAGSPFPPPPIGVPYGFTFTYDGK
jgi:protein TonB